MHNLIHAPSTPQILFYCMRSRRTGVASMIKAAMRGHLEATYALSVIQFNGSGGTRADRHPDVAAGLCARAANRGHVGALRELGFCLRDGYGIRRAVKDGRALILQAKKRENATAGSDIDATVANRFLTKWFAPVGAPGASSVAGGGDGGPPLLLCSYPLCGRQETRPHEFRRCAVCAAAKYCSRSCQARDWRIGHMEMCIPRVVDIQGDQPAGEHPI
jgi:hypothetical protein